MIWFLIAALLLLSLLVLAATVLTLWRKVKALGRDVAQAGETVTAASERIDAAKAGGPLGVEPCPTCGHKPPAVTPRAPAVRR